MSFYKRFLIFEPEINQLKTMNISIDTQVGEVVKKSFKTAPVFHANHIDYCCGGNKSIASACAEAGVEPEQLVQQLSLIAENADPDAAYINNLSLQELCEYIVKRHHAYVKGSFPFLKASLDKICDVHGTKHPELLEVRKLFNESAGELTMHMQKEEIMLFPYIQKMERAKKEGISLGSSPFGSVSNPIRMMVSEHETEGKRFDQIAGITGNYIPPADACTTYKATLNQLSEFESDLHRHIHLENNILFPQAIELETELSGR